MPSSSYPLVNSVIASSSSFISASTVANHRHLINAIVTASSSLVSKSSMGWTILRRSFASSILLLHPFCISARSSSSALRTAMTLNSVTTSKKRISTDTTTTTTTTAVSTAFMNAARKVAPPPLSSSRDGGWRRSVMTNRNNDAYGANGTTSGRFRWNNSWRSRLIFGCKHKHPIVSSSPASSTVFGPFLAESSSGHSGSSFASASSIGTASSQPTRHYGSTSSKSTKEEQEECDHSATNSFGGSSKLSSARSQAAIRLLPSYIADARAVAKYSPTICPEGALQLSVAENQLCELPITGMIGIVEGGGEVVKEGGGEEGMDRSVANKKKEMTLTDVLSQLASSKCPRPLDGDAGYAITNGNVFQRDMIYYQPTQGIPTLRRAMANYLQSLLLSSNEHSSSSSRQFNPDNVILGAGCNAVLENLCMCLANPGDAAMIPTPYYASFEFDLSARAGCHIVPVNTFNYHPGGQTVPSSCNGPIAPEFYYPNRSSLDAAYHRALLETGRPPRILLLSHPNNPLGICYPPRVVQECIEWCREMEVHLISDEIYAGSVYRKERTVGEDKGQPNFVSAMSLGCSTSGATHNGLGIGPFIHLVYALSKDFALSGLRVGVAYTENEEILLPLQKLNDLCQISSQTQLLVERIMCVNAIMNGGDAHGNGDLSQKFFDVYMEVNNGHIRARCDKLLAFLSNMGIPFLPADSGLFVWMDLREFLPPLGDGISEATESVESKEARERQLYLLLMREYGLLFTPGMSMRSERAGFFRFVFTAATEEEFDLGLVRLRKAVEKMRMRQQ